MAYWQLFFGGLVLCTSVLETSSLGPLTGILGSSGSSESETSSTSSLNYSPYYKGPVCMPSYPIQHPTSVDEVVQIVREAIKNGTTVKAFGARHSASDVLCTSGIPMDMHGIKGLVMNLEDNTVTVGAGQTLFEVTEFLKANGRAFKTTPAFGNITIGGAIGTGAHGSSVKYTSSISEQVIGLTVVDGLGNIREITSEDELHAFRIHLGLLGIVVSIKLRTEPLYKIMGHNYLTSDKMLFDGSFIDMVKSADQISLYWFPSFSQVVVANWTIQDVNTPGEAWTFDHVPSTYTAFNAVIGSAIELIQSLDSVQLLNVAQAMLQATLLTKVPGFVPIYTEDGITVKNPAVGFYDRMFAPTCNETGTLQCTWFHGPYNVSQLDNEIGLDIKDVPALAVTLKDIVSKYAAVFPFQGILMRFSEASETYMSTAYKRIECHFEFYMPFRKDTYNTASSGLGAYQTILQSIVYKYGGRPHWGKNGAAYHTTDMLARKLDPVAREAFLEVMDRYDPNGVFRNDFGERLKGTGTALVTDPKVTHCALLDYCFCTSDADCAPGQSCSHIEGYPDYPACLTPGGFVGVLDPNPNWQAMDWGDLSWLTAKAKSLLSILL